MKNSSIPKHIKISLLMLIVSMALMHAPRFLELAIPNSIQLQEISQNKFTSNVSGVTPGNYILSLGKARAICTLTSDSRSISPISSPSGIKPEISNDISLTISSTDKILSLDCSHSMKGFPPRLTHRPILLPFSSGRIVEITRYFVDVIFGTFAAGFLAIMVLYLAASSQTWMHGLVLLSVSSIFYALNQAYLFRTIWDGDINSLMHPISKAIFTWMLFRTLSNQTKFNILSFSLLIIPIAALASAYPNHDNINFAYKLFHVMWFLIFSKLYYDSKTSSRTELSRSLILLWTIALALDATTLANAFGPYYAPIFFGLLVFGLTIESGTIVKSTAFAFKTARELNSVATNKNIAPLSALTLFAEELKNKTGYAAYSTYTDMALLGESDRHRHSLKKISFSGNQREYFKDVIDILGGEGSELVSAIDSGAIIHQTCGSKTESSLLIPIGKHSIICLSTEATNDLANESFINILLVEIKSSVETLDLRLSELSTLLNSSLARIKKTHSNGSYEITSGAIFVDIADYSKHCEHYGTSYAEFISSSLFPALIRIMDGYATPEAVRGDEVYFVIVPQIVAKESSIEILTTEAAIRLHRFFNVEATQMANQNGFPAVEYRIGLTTGRGNLVIDDVHVRTSGEHINRAKRLQESANKGEVLSDIDLIGKSEGLLFLINKKMVVVKKNQIEAARVGFKKVS